MASWVSAASARALWNKLSQGVTPFGPEAILLHTPDSLRQFGLSRQKAAYTHGLATAVAAPTAYSSTRSQPMIQATNSPSVPYP